MKNRPTLQMLGLAFALGSTGWAQVTQRVSVDSGGAQGNTYSLAPSTSADGRYVAFVSHATNLVPGDTNGAEDVFVHDRLSGGTEGIRGVRGGAEGTSGSALTRGPSSSADGRYVTFVSDATNLVPGDTNGALDIFVHDRLGGATERVSVDSGGAQGNSDSGLSGGISISADGRYVTFASFATNLVPGDTNGAPDVFIHDRQDDASES